MALMKALLLHIHYLILQQKHHHHCHHNHPHHHHQQYHWITIIRTDLYVGPMVYADVARKSKLIIELKLNVAALNEALACAKNSCVLQGKRQQRRADALD